MIDIGQFSVLGVRIDAVDYEGAVSRILRAARSGDPCATAALATHGVMEGYDDPVHRRRLNGLDLVVPDGQPVRWALRWLHDVHLPDRVYGPRLMMGTLRACAEESLPVYFYGSTEETVERLVANLRERLPDLVVAGAEPSKFRRLSREESGDLTERIRRSEARVVFVGLGCPRQEVWAYEYRDRLSVPILAVGAAFDFHAGTLAQAPDWMQSSGFEWFYRLTREPRRLWRRYLILGPRYLKAVAASAYSGRAPDVLLPDGDEPELLFG